MTTWTRLRLGPAVPIDGVPGPCGPSLREDDLGHCRSFTADGRPFASLAVVRGGTQSGGPHGGLVLFGPQVPTTHVLARQGTVTTVWQVSVPSDEATFTVRTAAGDVSGVWDQPFATGGALGALRGLRRDACRVRARCGPVEVIVRARHLMGRRVTRADGAVVGRNGGGGVRLAAGLDPLEGAVVLLTLLAVSDETLRPIMGGLS